jgi:S1 RNA binding domain protein
MGLEVGAVVEARVTGITKFGAFVALPEGKSGLVHISEISSGYVNEVSEHLSVGQTVKVVVLNIAPDGKINLSIKRALPQERPAARPARPAANHILSVGFMVTPTTACRY